ncbi:hypothetical protein [Candidatus Halobonum tyrrellensis]|nr:hypothetical protein [Candidatus Halobonum tyrrellensis]
MDGGELLGEPPTNGECEGERSEPSTDGGELLGEPPTNGDGEDE